MPGTLPKGFKRVSCDISESVHARFKEQAKNAKFPMCVIVSRLVRDWIREQEEKK